MASLWEYVKKIKNVLLLFLYLSVIMTVLCYLYDVPAEVLGYGAALIGVVGIGLFLYEYYKYAEKKELLRQIKEDLPLSLDRLTEPEDEKEKLYQEIAGELNYKRMKSESEKLQNYEDMNDYYTMWVHQIKTPISALRLLLKDRSGENQEELEQLFKIEQYVEMVLGYLRTEDMSADMEFAQVSLDGVIREQIHKYAGTFVKKKLTLNYDGVEETVLTDAKWLGFVIGQILSNSLKYTKKGSISIFMCKTRPHTLVIEDTGIGINASDLPRVFEKGFTGHNGRKDNRSTGIGLYLCAKIVRKLRHEITIESRVGKGTSVYLYLGRKSLELYS